MASLSSAATVCAAASFEHAAVSIADIHGKVPRSFRHEFHGRPVASVRLTGSGRHSKSLPGPISFSLQPHVVASTSSSSTSSSAMTGSVPASDGGDAPFRQMSPEEHWQWGTPPRLIGNWHGQWRSWKPFESRDEIRSMKSVRKFWATSPDLSTFSQINDWYDYQGEVAKKQPTVGVQWDMSLAEHSLPDGFCHVFNLNARRYDVSRKVDAIWAPLEVADGEGGIQLPLLVEFFFSHTPTSRLGSVIGFEADGAFRASVVVEESLDTNERRPADWVWPTWGPGGVSTRMPDHLPPVPALDDKTMVGTRTILTRNLMVQERENVSWAEEWSTNSAAAAAAIAAFAGEAAGEAASAGETADGSSARPTAVDVAAAGAGFMGRVPEGDEDRYAVFALPQGVVVCAPRSLQLVAGRRFVLSVSWVVGEGEVKRITATWGADGGYERVEGERYTRQG
ncbi:hypothetical protein CLOM_g14811 [Closterium sp. NIES-68]|nr:hypothetical protein CLOM_g14811 [Closterium sp. NIES-68]GJP71224.1 hypothetical protein CLOP_g2080 [Closterium sp. NIES-67]